MGSSDFAVPALKMAHQNYHVVGVYTVPPRPVGRGKKIVKSSLHQYAEEHNIPVFTPLSLKEKEEQQQFLNLRSDIAIVASYGLILPDAILKAPRHGCLNIHASLLPKLRGASPIHHAIIEGLTETGNTIMMMDQGLDTGDIITMETCPIPPHATTQDLEKTLAEQGATLIQHVIDKELWQHHTPQDHTQATLTKKITKEDGTINFNEPADLIERKIRAFRHWPTCSFSYKDERIKILEADVEIGSAPEHKDLPYGTVIDDHLTILCHNSYLKPKRLQRPSKNALSRDDFLRGFPIHTMTSLQ